MKTYTVQIGNSDDELTQASWANYYHEIDVIIKLQCNENLHFAGPAPGNAPWQNACWVFNYAEENVHRLINDLTILRKAYQQESLAFTEGETSFI